MFLQVLCVGIVAILLGLILLFSGYRFFLFLLPIWGFFAGFALGAGTVTLIFGDGFLATVTGWVSGLVAGLVFGLLSYLFYIVGVAFVAGSVGYALGAGVVFAILANANVIAFVVGLVVAVIVAVLTLVLNLQKWVIIALTSFAGSTALFTSLLLFVGRIELADLGTNPVQAVISDSFIWLIAWIVVAVIGFVTQVGSTSRFVLETPEGNRAW
jgi:hypothetical protein